MAEISDTAPPTLPVVPLQEVLPVGTSDRWTGTLSGGSAPAGSRAAAGSPVALSAQAFTVDASVENFERDYLNNTAPPNREAGNLDNTGTLFSGAAGSR